MDMSQSERRLFYTQGDYGLFQCCEPRCAKPMRQFIESPQRFRRRLLGHLNTARKPPFHILHMRNDADQAMAILRRIHQFAHRQFQKTAAQRTNPSSTNMVSSRTAEAALA